MVGCGNPQGQRPSGQAGEVRGAPAAHPVPVAVKAFQQVFEAQRMRRAQPRHRVVHFQSRGVGGQQQRVRERDTLAVHTHRLNQRRRRWRQGAEISRHDSHQPLVGREPEPPIPCLPARGLKATEELGGAQAVGFIVQPGPKAFRLAARHRVQRRALHRDQPVRTAHPQSPGVILENSQHGELRQAVLQRELKQLASLQPRQTRLPATYPDHTFSIGIRCANQVTAQAFFFGPERVAVSCELHQATVAGEPEAPQRIAADLPEQGGRQACFLNKALPARIKPYEPAIGDDPEATAGIALQPHNVAVDQALFLAVVRDCAVSVQVVQPAAKGANPE